MNEFDIEGVKNTVQEHDRKKQKTKKKHVKLTLKKQKKNMWN